MTAVPEMTVTAARPSPAPSARPSPVPGSRAAQTDPRWTAVCAALCALRERRRHALRIVDADCGCGTMLVAAAREARALGFTAVEARGIDGAPALIGRARAAAARFRDPAVGLVFEVGDMVDALADEAAVPADIVLWHGDGAEGTRPQLLAALAAAGDRIIGDRAAPEIRERSAA
jgi:hypothetical protein